MDTPKGPGSEGRRSDIQGLRALAVLMVVAFHAGLNAPGGFVGVDVFFVISGYVIAAMLRREREASGQIDLRGFYVRRFKRLTPALSLTLTLVLVGSWYLLSPLGTQSIAVKTALGAITLVANVAIATTTGGYFDAPAETNPFLHTWSLSVEEQFYLVFPALLAIGWALGAGTSSERPWSRPVVLIVACVSLASLAAALVPVGVLSFRGAQFLFGFYSPVSRTWEFGVGALLALAAPRCEPKSRRLATLMGVSGLGLVLTSVWIITGATTFPGPWTAVPVVGTAFILAAGAHAANPVALLLASRPLAKLGDWSYSVYLWHWPFVVCSALLWPGSELAKGIAALVSLVPALVSYYWVEEPLRALPSLVGRRLAMLVGFTLLTPVGLAIAITAGAGVAPRVAAAMEAVSTQHAASERGCLTQGPFGLDLGARCWWNADATEAPIYLVGDSDAWHFSEGVIGAAQQLGRPAWVLTSPSCPFVDGLEIRGTGRSPYFPGPWPATEFAHCHSYLAFTLQWLAQARPGVVVVASLDQYFWDTTLAVALGPGPATTDASSKAELLRDGLVRTLERVRAAGHHVLVVQTVPTFRNPAPIWTPRTCSGAAVLAGHCSREVAVEVVDAYQASSRAALADAARLTGAGVLDLRAWLCPNERCTTHRDGAWLYMDATHLTVAASRQLVPEFAKAIEAAKRK